MIRLRMSYLDGFTQQLLSWSVSLRRQGKMLANARWQESGKDYSITHIKEAEFWLGEKEAKAIWDEFSALVPEGQQKKPDDVVVDDAPTYEITLVEAHRTRTWKEDGRSSLDGKDSLVRKIDAAFQAFNKRLQGMLGFERIR